MFKLNHDTLTPSVRRLSALARNPQPILRSMGTALKSITEGNFNSAGASMRPIPWRNKRDGTPSNLQLNHHLSRSFYLTVSDIAATVGTPIVYARIHQFGGEIVSKSGGLLTWVDVNGKRIFAKKVTEPPRPFFPVWNGRITPAADRLLQKAADRTVQREYEG